MAKEYTSPFCVPQDRADWSRKSSGAVHSKSGSSLEYIFVDLKLIIGKENFLQEIWTVVDFVRLCFYCWALRAMGSCTDGVQKTSLHGSD